MTHPPTDKPQNTDRWACCVSWQNKKQSRWKWKRVENKSTADSLSNSTSENFKRPINSKTLQPLQSKREENTKTVLYCRSQTSSSGTKTLFGCLEKDDAGRRDDWCSARPDSVYGSSTLKDSRLANRGVWDDPQCNLVGMHDLSTSMNEI